MSEYKTHDSWGMVGIYHQHHGGRQLFGSDVTNYNTICLKVKTAQCSREFGRDWIMGDKTLIEINLSANQFADLLTNANVGDGVPCTIEYVRGQGMIKYQPQEPKLKIIEEERDALAEKAVSDIHSSIAMVKELIEKKKISKTIGEELLFNMNGALSSLVGGGKEFYKKQAKQEVENMVVEAKRQVQSYEGALEDKLDEEVIEYHESKSVEEIADIIEVLNAIIKANGHSRFEVFIARMKKKKFKGGFKRRAFLEEVKEEVVDIVELDEDELK